MSIVRKKVVLLHPQNDASVAQLVEHLTLNQGVQGSTPCGSTEKAESLTPKINELGVFLFPLLNVCIHLNISSVSFKV